MEVTSIVEGSMADADALVQPWLDLWNGDLSRIGAIIADDWVAHAAPVTGGPVAELRGPESLAAWIGGLHTTFADLRFAIEVGPIIGDDHIAVRWRAEGTYAGGLPGSAPAAAGRTVSFTGTDVLRVAGGRLAEYWVNTDSLWFAEQVGIR
jgi:predicted ester cyclase